MNKSESSLPTPNDSGYIECRTAGALNNELSVNVHVNRCGHIEDGISFEAGSRSGSWVLSFSDLERIYDAARRNRGLGTRSEKERSDPLAAFIAAQRPMDADLAQASAKVCDEMMREATHTDKVGRVRKLLAEKKLREMNKEERALIAHAALDWVHLVESGTCSAGEGRLREELRRLRQWFMDREDRPGHKAQAIYIDGVLDIAASVAQSAIKESIPLAILREHWLHQVECNHETKQDMPICACSKVNLGWHPSVGAAVEAWLDHLQEVASPDRNVDHG